MKKLFGILFVFIIILAGCGSNGTSDSITVWAMGDEGNMLAEFTAPFTEETGVKVEVVAIPWDQANEKLTTAIASGTGPDVVQMGNTWIPQFAESGALADLSDYVEKYENFNLDLYFDGASDTALYNDTQYSVPWYVDTRLLYYRSDLVNDFCGNVPTTQTELLDCAVKLGERGDGLYGLDIDVNDQTTTTAFAWANGWEFQDEDGSWNFDDKEYTEALQLLSDFGTKGATFYDSGLDITNTFFDGTVPMFMSGPWMVNTLNTVAPDSTDKWSVATMPSGSSNNSTVQGGTNWAMFETSKSKEVAAEFINWMLTTENQDSWYETANSLPARKDTWEMDKYKNDEKLSIWNKQLKVAKPVPTDRNYEALAQEMISQQQAVTLTGKDPKDAAAEMIKYTDSLE